MLTNRLNTLSFRAVTVSITIQYVGSHPTVPCAEESRLKIVNLDVEFDCWFRHLECPKSCKAKPNLTLMKREIAHTPRWPVTQARLFVQTLAIQLSSTTKYLQVMPSEKFRCFPAIFAVQVAN